jgi:hypothetical protein
LEINLLFSEQTIRISDQPSTSSLIPKPVALMIANMLVLLCYDAIGWLWLIVYEFSEYVIPVHVQVAFDPVLFRQANRVILAVPVNESVWITCHAVLHGCLEDTPTCRMEHLCISSRNVCDLLIGSTDLCSAGSSLAGGLLSLMIQTQLLTLAPAMFSLSGYGVLPSLLNLLLVIICVAQYRY